MHRRRRCVAVDIRVGRGMIDPQPDSESAIGFWRRAVRNAVRSLVSYSGPPIGGNPLLAGELVNAGRVARWRWRRSN